ncbi:unnamed protein product, partial [Rotaria magnacalcarata]
NYLYGETQKLQFCQSIFEHQMFDKHTSTEAHVIAAAN